MIFRMIFSLILMLGCGVRASSQEPLEYLFESGTEGYHTYRIPAIVTTTEGSILTFCEGRKNGGSDTGNIDLLMKRSTDNGKTWSDLMVIRDDGANVCGNPAPVVDESTGIIHLLSTWNSGDDPERNIIDGISFDTRRVFIMRSSDDGLTWTKSEEITKTVKKENWTWYATGPCHGIQIGQGPFQGRLVIPCDHIEAGSKKYFSHIIYSDNHGESWKLGGTTPQDQVNECTIAELTDGRLMLNMRNYDRSQKSRKIALSADGGATWDDIFADEELIEPICQASLLAISKEDQGQRILYFLNPADEDKRQKMTLRVSEDEGLNWNRSMILHNGPSAYSDMTLLKNGNLGCLFEGGNSTPYQGIVFQEVSF